MHDPNDNCVAVFNPNQADFDQDGMGDACDPSPFGDVGLPTFSQTAPVPPDACLCMPPMMNLQPGEVQNWYVQADASGALTVVPTLFSVNPDETGQMKIDLYDPSSNLVDSQTLVFPTTGSLTGPPMVDSPSVSGGIYKVQLTLLPPAEGPAAHHYYLKFNGATEAAMESPSLRQAEAAPATWGLNVDSAESELRVRISSVGLTAPAGYAEIVLRDPSGTVAISKVIDSNGPTPFDDLLSVLNPLPGRWTLHINTVDPDNLGTGHYSIDKQSGSDRGIYLTWHTFGTGTIAVELTVAGSPLPGPVPLDLFKINPDSTETFLDTFGVVAGVNVLPPTLPVGTYRLESTPPAGYSASFTSLTVQATCDKQAQVVFHLAEISQPPAADARTIGYWKNHEDHIADILSDGPIRLGDPPPGDPMLVTTVEQAVEILSASAKDARDALSAQLLATILNLRNGADPLATGEAIRPTVNAGRDFLATHSDPVTAKHPDRGLALELKDKLDAFNNSGES